MELTLRAAGPADIELLLALESDPEAARFVTCWPASRHEEALSRPDELQLVLCEGERPAGFVLLAGIGAAGGVIELRRIVVSPTGRGIGRRALDLTLEHCFGALGARRVWLDVMPHNARARRAYEAVGFCEDGIAPRGPGEDLEEPLLVMSIGAAR
jgi:diamine N-acetyltransferase